MAAVWKRLSPETQALLQKVKERAAKPYNELPVDEARQKWEAIAHELSGEFDFKGTTENIHIPSKNVQGGIPAIVCHPTETKQNAPILVYFHGGGLVLGSAAARTINCQRFAQQWACIIVNVEYRLAPEHKFPHMIYDAKEAVEWIIANKCQLGGTTKSLIGVFGDSGGGTLTAAVSHDVPGVDFQMLIYPWTVSGKSLPSYQVYGENLLLTNALIDWFYMHVFEKDDDSLDPRMVACNREKFDHLPPALFIVAECDPIRDDSYVYAAKLMSAGVPTDIVTVQGTVHGFFPLPDVCKNACAEAYQALENFVNRMYNAE